MYMRKNTRFILTRRKKQIQVHSSLYSGRNKNFYYDFSGGENQIAIDLIVRHVNRELQEVYFK